AVARLREAPRRRGIDDGEVVDRGLRRSRDELKDVVAGPGDGDPSGEVVIRAAEDARMDEGATRRRELGHEHVLEAGHPGKSDVVDQGEVAGVRLARDVRGAEGVDRDAAPEVCELASEIRRVDDAT